MFSLFELSSSKVLSDIFSSINNVCKISSWVFPFAPFDNKLIIWYIDNGDIKIFFFDSIFVVLWIFLNICVWKVNSSHIINELKIIMKS